MEIIKILSPYIYYNKKKDYVSRGKTEADIKFITQKITQQLFSLMEYI